MLKRNTVLQLRFKRFLESFFDGISSTIPVLKNIDLAAQPCHFVHLSKIYFLLHVLRSFFPQKSAPSRKTFLFRLYSGYLPTFGPTFINLYGSPREYSDLPDKFEAMNLAKGEGCAYRGRVLCELQTELVDEMQESGVVPMTEDSKIRITVSQSAPF